MRCSLLGLAGLVSWFLFAATLRADTEDPHIGGKNLKQWIAEIHHPDPGVREKAIRTVPFFGKEARKAGRALVTELADKDTSLCVNAIMAIGIIGLDGEEFTDGVKILGKILLTNNQHINRFQAAVTLGKLGPDAKAAIPALCSAVRDLYNSWETRRAAAVALRSVAMDRKEGPDAKAIHALVRAASDVCLEVRLEAVMSLIYLGLPAQKADLESEKVALQRLTRDREPLLSLWARVALMRIDKVSDLHLRAIGQMLRSTDVMHRVNAANALAMIGAAAKSQVPDLIEALRDKDVAVIMAAIAALARIGDEAQRAIPALTRLTDDKNEMVKVLAKDAIDTINNKDKPKKPAAK